MQLNSGNNNPLNVVMLRKSIINKLQNAVFSEFKVNNNKPIFTNTTKYIHKHDILQYGAIDTGKDTIIPMMKYLMTGPKTTIIDIITDLGLIVKYLDTSDMCDLLWYLNIADLQNSSPIGLTEDEIKWITGFGLTTQRIAKLLKKGSKL